MLLVSMHAKCLDSLKGSNHEKANLSFTNSKCQQEPDRLWSRRKLRNNKQGELTSTQRKAQHVSDAHQLPISHGNLSWYVYELTDA